jgi:hypothetical protein
VEIADQSTSGSFISCKICGKDCQERADLIEHLRTEHETLELASYAAATMANDEERDRTAMEFRRRFDHLRREVAGQESER